MLFWGFGLVLFWIFKVITMVLSFFVALLLNELTYGQKKNPIMNKTKWEAMTIKQLHPKLIQLNLNQFNKYVSPAFGIFSWIPD